MNHQLAVNIIQQFDNELSALVSIGISTLDLQEKKDAQSKLETLIKQRGEAIDYINKELSK